MWACQPVAFIISANVAPLARLMRAITSAFLLERSAMGLGAFVGLAFFASLAFLPDFPFGFGCSASLAARRSRLCR